jgi:DNA adenine methylase
MKTPISYYGGKQMLVKTILALIPEHRLYCEPFIGGGAVFFAKKPANVEIINDANGELINFYQVAKSGSAALENEIGLTLHSRRQHEFARLICQNPDFFDPVKRAWAIWMLANSSYGSKLDGGYAYDRTGSSSRKFSNKRRFFTASECAGRLEGVQIENCDAVRLIKSRDVPDGFFYLDPPYVGADQGHYDGYSQVDFDELLKTLETLKGKFLLSSYRNKTLTAAVQRNGWHTVELKMSSPMKHNNKTSGKEKIEVMTANYPLALDKQAVFAGYDD